MMSVRELFARITKFEHPDRTPVWNLEGITVQAERKWCKEEGFPLGMRGGDALAFDASPWTIALGNQTPLPAFVPRTLSSDENYIITSDQYGFIVKTERKSVLSPTHYTYIGAPLKTREDWRRISARYDPTDARRYPPYWGEAMFEHYNNSTAPVGVGVNWGPCRGIKNGYMFGFERFMEILMEEPETLEEVFDFWADFQIRLLSPCIDKLKIDVFFFNEDGMAYKNSTLVSPVTFGRVYQPYMKRVTDFLRSKGVSVIGYYTSGNLKPLIPSFLDIGINMIGPVEVAAGMDAVELRKEYGRDLLMMGNISRESVMRGKAEIEKEVMRKVPYLMEAGGYIPALDDMVMPDMRFEDVRYCVDLIRSVVP